MDDRVVKVAGLRSAGEIRVGSNPTPCIPQSMESHFLKEKVEPLPTLISLAPLGALHEHLRLHALPRVVVQILI